MTKPRAKDFDDSVFISISQAATYLGWSSNTQQARVRLKSNGIKIASSYVRGDDMVPLFKRVDIEALKKRLTPVAPPPPPKLASVNPAPNASQPAAPSPGVNIDFVHTAPPIDKATKDALQFTIQRMERMITELSHAPQAVSNVPIIERLDQLLKRPATPLTSSEGLRDLQTQMVAMNSRMEELMKGMHALTQLQIQILEAVTKP